MLFRLSIYVVVVMFSWICSAGTLGVRQKTVTVAKTMTTHRNEINLLHIVETSQE